MAPSRYVLKLSCPDRKGIVSAVAGFLAAQDCNILDSAQFGDADNGRFFMRVSFAASRPTSVGQLQADFGPVQTEFAMHADSS
jgi:formyltetrahydrofolate deformylase